jgi:hypothetical protein
LVIAQVVRKARQAFFFFEKRSKKLLHMASGVSLDRETPVLAETDKSFLVLFFKKEHPSWLCHLSMLRRRHKRLVVSCMRL